MKINFYSTFIKLKYRLVNTLSTRPFLYYGLRRITGKMDYLCVNDETELVIEGYPRSANSSTAHGFLSCQSRPVRVAHHKHHAAQLLLAANRNLPAVILIRKPEDALLSLLALDLENQKRNKNAKSEMISFQDALSGWITFYKATESYADSFVIAPFNEVTQDLSGMIQEINAKFGTNFEYSPSTEPPELGWHATPNNLRNEIKLDLSAQFTETLESSPRFQKMLNEANTLYQRFIDLHERHR